MVVGLLCSSQPRFSARFVQNLTGVSVVRRNWKTLGLTTRPCTQAELDKFHGSAQSALGQLEASKGKPVEIRFTTQQLAGALPDAQPVLRVEYQVGSQTGRYRVSEGPNVSWSAYKKAFRGAVDFLKDLPVRPTL